MTLNDAVPKVVEKLRGRSDLNSNILGWLQDAILNLTESYPFEELAFNGPVTNFVQGQAAYPLNYFLGSNAPAKWTRILSWWTYFESNNPPLNPAAGFNIKGRVLQTVEGMSNITGIPKYYAQVGKTLLIGYMPDQSYTTYMRVQQEHPFDQNLGASHIFLPNDWLEILYYSAAIRGCDYIGANDLAQTYLVRLHGDPTRPKDIGLIKSVQAQQTRNLSNNERQIAVVVRKYC